MFFCEFFEIIKDKFFIKHLRETTFEFWRPEKSSWLLVEDIIFQSFEAPHLEWWHSDRPSHGM